MTIRIAMICMGNICRSPIAEHVMRKKAEDAGLNVYIESGGTGGWHAGEPADTRAQQVLMDNGYTHKHVAQQISRYWFDNFDHLIVMDSHNLHALERIAHSHAHRKKIALLRSFDKTAGRHAEVPDPYYGTAEDFKEVLKMVERACDGFVAYLLKHQ
jgi:protein-tyrosine phosphatase